MSESKSLLQSQRELIRIKVAQAQTAQSEAQATINQVARELGIDPEENWKLAEDLSRFDKPEPPKE